MASRPKTACGFIRSKALKIKGKEEIQSPGSRDQSRRVPVPNKERAAIFFKALKIKSTFSSKFTTSIQHNSLKLSKRAKNKNNPKSVVITFISKIAHALALWVRQETGMRAKAVRRSVLAAVLKIMRRMSGTRAGIHENESAQWHLELHEMTGGVRGINCHLKGLTRPLSTFVAAKRLFLLLMSAEMDIGNLK
ncbi:hypothetical protein C8R44DRAFT_945518 [Mycena epipterygia]|nr:hypothetical protein C8R44DRAFT_945518 [Mycena epipterygia]